jgi:IS1 family transposase
MNRLSIQERPAILGMLVEGNSLRACARMADVSLNTVTKLLVDVGTASEQFHNERVVNVRVRRLQCDDIWSFVGSKERHTTPEKKMEGCGDAWTWIGLDADTKLCLSFLVGGRDASWASLFMEDCARRITGRVQVTTDGHRAYLEAIEGAFGMDCDYAMLVKQYGLPTEEEARRYSPARCIGCETKVISGQPDPKHINTAYVERFNLTMRMSMRRFTRLTNAFSKKLRNHELMIAIHAVHYNFVRMHKTLRCSPAMAADLSKTLWSLEDMIEMTDSYIPKPGKRGPYKKKSTTKLG